MSTLYKTLNLTPISPTSLAGISNYSMPTITNMPTVLESITTPNNFGYESGMLEDTPYVNTGYDYEDISSGVGINDKVANAYTRDPRLGAITEKATNLGNRMVSGALNTGRDIQSAYNGMDTFQKIDKVTSSVKGLWDSYNGYKNNKMINRQLNFSMDMANKQYEANRKRINSQLEDRQARRHAEQPHANQSVADYMKKYGV